MSGSRRATPLSGSQRAVSDGGGRHSHQQGCGATTMHAVILYSVLPAAEALLRPRLTVLRQTLIFISAN